MHILFHYSATCPDWFYQISYAEIRKKFPIVVIASEIWVADFCWMALAGKTVTGQLADTSTRGLPTRGLDNSRSRRCRQKGKISTQSR